MKHQIYFATGCAVILLALMGVGSALQPMRYLPPESTFADQPLDTKNLSHAKKQVEEIIARFQNRTVTIADNHEIEQQFSLIELGISYDPEKNFQSLVKTTNWLKQKFFASATEPAVSKKPIVKIDRNLLRKKVSEFLKVSERAPTPANLVWNQTQWQTQDEKVGLKLKDGALEQIEQLIIVQLYPLIELPVIQADYEEIAAPIIADDLTELKNHANTVSKNPIKLKLADQRYTLAMEGSQWITVDPIARKLSLNKTQANVWVKSLEDFYNTEPGMLTVESTHEFISEYDKKPYQKANLTGSFEKGKSVSASELFTLLDEYIQNPEPKKEYEVPVEVHNPVITSPKAYAQFPHLLATGRSSYRLGNYRERVVNIQKSLLSFDGVIIPPGEELSFNRVTGWVTPAKGYTKTKVIVADEVVEGVGGGVCQSSTTMYRAAVNAGLEIKERSPHSLDVEYYHAYGYGIDAAVYTDSRSDLRFVNNTGNPILIHTYLAPGYEAVVEFYGTSDGRKVELSNIPTGNPKYKKWAQVITWPEETGKEETVKYVESKYRDPKPKEEIIAETI
jgi:vancomycin resistance protein YoaR